MLIINLAWNNLWYNKKRTTLQLLLILITLSALILYRGYVDYAREGMALGFIEKSGHIQISSVEDGKILNSIDLEKINLFLKNVSEIEKIETVLNFSGIIGNEQKSTIFWGQAFDNPETRYGIVKGEPAFSNSESIVLGKLLADSLNISPEKNNIVNILTNSNNSGITMSSFTVVGLTDTGIPENDEGLLIAPRKTIIEFLGEDNIASCIQIKLKETKFTNRIEKQLTDSFPEFKIQNWQELNPSYNQVNSMNEMQCIVISIIMCILVFVSLTQSLSTAFNERLYEFGMLEAIGLKKIKIFFLLYAEVFFLVFIGIILGLFNSVFLDYFISLCRFEFIPPGYSSGFILNFFITYKNIIGSILFIIGTSFFAILIPINNVKKSTVVKLMNHQE